MISTATAVMYLSIVLESTVYDMASIVLNLSSFDEDRLCYLQILLSK